MKWKLIFLLIIVALIVLAYFYSLPPKPKLEISQIYNVNLEPGQTIIVNVTVSDVVDLFCYRVNIAWDPYILKVSTGDPEGWKDPFTYVTYNIYEGPFLKQFSNWTNFIINEVDNERGKIVALYGGFVDPGDSASGTGVVATINFTCIHPGTTTIEIVGGDPSAKGHALLGKSGGETIPHDEVHGIVSNGGPPPPWTDLGFVVMVVIVEVITLAILSAIIVSVKRPKRKRAKQEKDELEELLEEL